MRPSKLPSKLSLLVLAGLFVSTFQPGCSCKKDNTNNGNDLSASTSDGGEDLSVAEGDLSGMMSMADLTDPGIPLDAFADGGIVIVENDGGTTSVCYITACAGKVYACGDCKDNDGDGLFDSHDPDCLGPCQNNEAGFQGNIPGQNNAPCKADCYWDKDSGGGGDTCSWSHKCDPFEQGSDMFPGQFAPEVGCAYDPNAKVPGATVPNGQKDCAYLKDNQTTTCTNSCAPLTPNGCDCFGCCENPLNPGKFVYAGSVDSAGIGTCSAKASDLNDPLRCKACTPVAGACYKPCGYCQLCFGKTTLPAECVASMPDMFGVTPPDMTGQPPADMTGQPPPDLMPPPAQCPPDQQACGLPGQPECGTGGYCISGCCVFTIP